MIWSNEEVGEREGSLSRLGFAVAEEIGKSLVRASPTPPPAPLSRQIPFRLESPHEQKTPHAHSLDDAKGL